MNNYLDFISDDVQVRLLKMGRVGMIRRTLSFRGSVRFDELVYLPLFNGFIVLKFGGFA